MKFLLISFILWATAWIGWELTKYNYERKVKPSINPFIYRLQAHWELYQIRVAIKEKEIREREYVEECEIEEVLPIETKKHQPRTTIWVVENYKEIGERRYLTQEVEK